MIYLTVNDDKAKYLIKSFSENIMAENTPMTRHLNIALAPEGKDLLKTLSEYCANNSVSKMSFENELGEVIYSTDEYSKIENLNINFNFEVEKTELVCNIICTKIVE